MWPQPPDICDTACAQGVLVGRLNRRRGSPRWRSEHSPSSTCREPLGSRALRRRRCRAPAVPRPRVPFLTSQPPTTAAAVSRTPRRSTKRRPRRTRRSRCSRALLMCQPGEPPGRARDIVEQFLASHRGRSGVRFVEIRSTFDSSPTKHPGSAYCITVVHSTQCHHPVDQRLEQDAQAGGHLPSLLEGHHECADLADPRSRRRGKNQSASDACTIYRHPAGGARFPGAARP